MKAVVYSGPREIEVKDMPDARIERATDVLVEITTTNICGPTFTCTKAVPPWSQAVFLATRILASLSKSGRPSTASKSEIVSACPSTSDAASARTVKGA
jgi:hypothetical protein